MIISFYHFMITNFSVSSLSSNHDYILIRDLVPIMNSCVFLVPFGILNEKSLCIIGNGAIVHLPRLFEEIDRLESNRFSCQITNAPSTSSNKTFHYDVTIPFNGILSNAYTTRMHMRHTL